LSPLARSSGSLSSLDTTSAYLSATVCSSSPCLRNASPIRTRFRSRRRRCGCFSFGEAGVSRAPFFPLLLFSSPDFAHPCSARSDAESRRDVEPRIGDFERDRSRSRLEAGLFDLFLGDMVGFCVMENAHHDAVYRASMGGAQNVAGIRTPPAPRQRGRVVPRLNEANATRHAM
jgi:hypothetical protein